MLFCFIIIIFSLFNGHSIMHMQFIFKSFSKRYFLPVKSELKYVDII